MGVIRKHAAHSPILSDLKTIYQAALDRVTEKWSPKYPNSMKRWKDNWDAVSPIFRDFTATDASSARSSLFVSVSSCAESAGAIVVISGIVF